MALIGATMTFEPITITAKRPASPAAPAPSFWDAFGAGAASALVPAASAAPVAQAAPARAFPWVPVVLVVGGVALVVWLSRRKDR